MHTTRLAFRGLLTWSGMIFGTSAAGDAWAGPCVVVDGVCDTVSGEEDVGCPQDCGCEAVGCGNSSIVGCFCDPCCFDSGDCCADADTFCGIVASGCPDGSCDPVCFEDCENCPSDCACTPPEVCEFGGYCTSCGNGVCDSSETACTCPAECAESCGDACCTGSESATTCWIDCCGDGSCDTGMGETCDTCFADCCGPGDVCAGGICTSCGNGRCEEDCLLCPSDCYCPGTCSGTCDTCGDGFCDTGETECNCPVGDCGDVCPDGCCSSGENETNCPADCPRCGDAVCQFGEDCASCLADCSCAPPMVCEAGSCTACSNGFCDTGETCASCPADCGGCSEPGAEPGADGPASDGAPPDVPALDGPTLDAEADRAPPDQGGAAKDLGSEGGPPETEEEGGCSCRLDGRRRVPFGAFLGAGLLLLARGRRRRETVPSRQTYPGSPIRAAWCRFGAAEERVRLRRTES